MRRCRRRRRFTEEIVLLALPTGILIGLSLGALGGGGSILTVPALVYLLGESPHSATTASLIIVGVTSLVAMAVHLRAGWVRVRSGIVFGVLGAGGAFAGRRREPSPGRRLPRPCRRSVW
jgi:uncharacterized protein